jgi:hypothetical protein
MKQLPKINAQMGVTLIVLILIGGCAGSASSDGMRAGAENDEPWAGADADSDADGDADSDGDGDTDSSGPPDDGFPPELERPADYKVPQGVGRYVFIADEAHDSVVVVDSDTLEIRLVEVGSRPTFIVPVSHGKDTSVAVTNLDSDEVTLLTVLEDGKIEKLDLAIRPDTNALAASPDGRFLVAFHDPQYTAESGVPSTDQEITVLDTTNGKEKSFHMTVGMHPWRVVYNDDISTVYVITEEGINIIDLAALGETGIPPIVTPFEPGTFDSDQADIEIVPDGTVALARKTGEARLVVARLDMEDAPLRKYDLPAVPTDLDISSDGAFGVLVLRALNQVAIFDLPLPVDPEEDPFRYIDLGNRIAGVATIAYDGLSILLHTTTAGEDEDKRRITQLALEKGEWEISSSVLERKIRALAIGVDSQVAIAVHQEIQPGLNELPFSYSLLALPSLQAKFQQIPVEPGQLLLTPDGDKGYLLLEDARRADVIDLNTFIVDTLQLGSAPTAAGYAVDTDKVFIAQDHPAGRMTFVGVHDGSVKTVTGYNLNEDIEY